MRKGRKLSSKIHGGAMVQGVNDRWQKNNDSGRKNAKLNKRGRKNRKIGSARA